MTIANDVIYDYDDDTSVHAKLFKTIGLYQLLQPITGSGYVTMSFMYRRVMLTIVWLITTLNCMQIIRLYLEIDNVQLFPYAFMMTMIGLTIAYKGKYDELFDVIRPIILVQILISSFSMITFVYCIILGYLMGLSIFSAPILKYVTAYVTFALHLFVYCYVLTFLETAKSKINFGLYSSNWTEMDLTFKKTLLLAMNMNSAHLRRMKISPKLIINLEMFAFVITMSFKVVPILLNINVEK